MPQLSADHLKDEFPELYAAGMKFVDTFLVREGKDREASSNAKKVELAQSYNYADVDGWTRGLEYLRGTSYMFGVASFVAVYGRRPETEKDDAEISTFLKSLRMEKKEQ